MKIKLFFFLFFPGFSSFAQYTLIPDVNFEKELIAKGIDTDGLNGKVSTFNINTVPYLNVSSRSINDLTGIQDFTALRTLLCYANKLASLNLSKNINLDYLDCSFNILTNLDLTKNTALSSFFL